LEVERIGNPGVFDALCPCPREYCWDILREVEDIARVGGELKEPSSLLLLSSSLPSFRRSRERLVREVLLRLWLRRGGIVSITTDSRRGTAQSSLHHLQQSGAIQERTKQK
jgi:hypothetical protein